MKINARQVKEAGQLTVVVSIPGREIDANPPSGVAYPEPFSCRVSAIAVEDQIVIQGQLKGQPRLSCSRCLEEYGQPVTTQFDLASRMQDGDVELSGEIAQAVILALPMKPLCRDGCLGLCTHCGQNLNLSPCGCRPEPFHPGLMPLKDLKPNT